ncbi:MAG: flavodoxin family protein [Desulfovibrionaceae bacterium]
MSPTVLGCSGSPRKGGNSDLLLKAMLRGARKAGLSVFSASLRDYSIQPCVGCEQCRSAKACTRLNDGMQLLYPRLEESRGLALACPTHNYNITAWMKAFIDRLYCYYEFDMRARPRKWSSRLAGQGRFAILAAVCEQAEPKDMGFTLDAMRLPLEALGYTVVGELPVLNVFDRGGVRDMPEILARAEELGSMLALRLGKD